MTTFTDRRQVVQFGVRRQATQPLFSHRQHSAAGNADHAGVDTTVSVPDGGTLLLGGQTLAGEIEREEGVPILSKIPFLKRLFTNRRMAKDDQVLLILVKPTIIIQREREPEQFPLLDTKTGGSDPCRAEPRRIFPGAFIAALTADKAPEDILRGFSSGMRCFRPIALPGSALTYTPRP